MRKSPHVGLGPAALVFSAALLFPTLGTAASEPASALAAELAGGMSQALGKPASRVLVEPPQSSDPAVVTFQAAFVKALGNEQGISLIDRAGLEASIKEAATGGTVNDNVMTELAGAAGARIIIRLDAQKSGAGYIVQARATDVLKGTLLATGRVELGQAAAGAPVEADTLQAQLRRLSDKLARALDALDGDLRYQEVAVLRFDEAGARAKESQLGLLVSSELTTALRRDHGILLVERTQLNKILEEQALGQTGVVDEKSAVEVGKLAGAQFLVLGSVSEAGDRYLVNAKIVSTADGLLHGAEEVSLPAADLIALSAEAVVLRSTSGAVYRSILLPGWGQFYNRQAVKGTVFIGAEVLAGSLALTFQLLGNRDADRYSKLGTGTSQARFDAVASSEESNYSRRDYALVALAILHAANILDAFISGKTFESATSSSGAFTFSF